MDSVEGQSSGSGNGVSNAEVAEWLGTALPRQITRVRISFSALMHRWPSGWAPAFQAGYASPILARCLPDVDFREVISFVRRQGGSTPTSGSAGWENGGWRKLAVIRLVHTQETAGSNPAPATLV